MKSLLFFLVTICTTFTYLPAPKQKVQVVSKRKDWSSTVTGKRKLYLDHIYNTSK
jgi:hypothetical protein